ncbi:cytochrome B [Bacteroidota bacterium]
MYKIILTSHSHFRYILLLLLVIVFIKSVYSFFRKKNYSKLDNGLNLSLMITFHIQLLIGFTLYFISPMVQFGSETMSNSVLRYWTFEHLLMMLVAVILITVNRVGLKHVSEDRNKHRRIMIQTGIVIVFVFGALVMSGRGII